MKIPETLCYDDVLLVPQYSDIRSRSECETSMVLGPGVELKIPIISTCMDTVTEDAMAGAMAQLGGLGVIHRYNTADKQADMVRSAIDLAEGAGPVAAAIGVTDDYFKRANLLVDAGATALCIDVAHGHHALVKQVLEELRATFGPDFCLIAGNVATLQGVNDLGDWGANAIRCNIGGGSICSTRIQTGHGVPGFETIFQTYHTDRNVTLIADGGLRNSGDIVKAIAAGADCVMLGSLLAGTDEAPGMIINNWNQKLKTYRGMASTEAQFEWRGRASSLEGISTTVPYKGSVKDIVTNLMQGFRSGMSYSGARDIKELQRRAQFIRQTPAGARESGTHILNNR